MLIYTTLFRSERQFACQSTIHTSNLNNSLIQNNVKLGKIRIITSCNDAKRGHMCPKIVYQAQRIKDTKGYATE